MKLYGVVESYYDYCDVWEEIESYWVSEEKAYLRLLEIEESYKKDGCNLEQYSAHVKTVITED